MVKNNNKSSNVKFTVLNECLTLSQICKKYNLNYKKEVQESECKRNRRGCRKRRN